MMPAKKNKITKTKNSPLEKSSVKSKINIPSTIPKHIWIIGTILSLIFFTLYLITSPRTNVSYADSDELLTVAYNLGVAHPSGYPIYTLLLHFFTNLPIPGTISFRGSLFTSILHSTSLLFLFVSIWKLLTYLREKSQEKLTLISSTIDPIFFSLLSVSFLGSSFVFWLYSIVTEKYSFNNLLLSVLIYFIVQFVTSNENKNFLPITITFALLLSHHQTSLFLIPMFIYLIYTNKNYFSQKKIIINIFSFLLILLSSLVILYLINLRNVNISWRFDQNLKSLFNHVLRQEFSGQQISSGQSINAYLPRINPPSSIKSISPYFKNLFTYFGLIPILTIFIGILFLKKIDQLKFNIFFYGLIFTGLFFPLYITWPTQIGYQVITIRQYLMGFIFFPIFIAVGLWISFSRIKKSLLIITNKEKTLTLTLLLISLLFIIFRIQKIFGQVNLKNYNFISQFHHQILADLPKNSILACFTDTSCFALLYEQNINSFRKDVDIIPQAYPLVMNNIKTKNLQAFNYKNNPYLTYDILTNNLDKRPTYVLDLPQNYYELLGIRFGFTYYIPEGYVGRLTRQIPENYQISQFNLTQKLMNDKIPELDIMRQYIRSSIARIHAFNATHYMKMGDRSEARRQLNLTSNLLYDLPYATFEQINSQRQGIEGSKPLYNYKPGSKVQTSDEILTYYKQYLNEGKIQKALGAAQGAVTINPFSEEARMALANIYEKLGDIKFAKIEYENVLRYYPNNEIAQKKLQELSR